MDEVEPGLFLSSAGEAGSSAWLGACRIDRILNCAVELHRMDYPAGPWVVERIGLLDADSYEEEPAAEAMIRAAAGIIHQWRQAGLRVLVHCRAGISRSPTVVAAYLMLYGGTPGALNQVRAARPCVRPNAYYLGILDSLSPSESQWSSS